VAAIAQAIVVVLILMLGSLVTAVVDLSLILMLIR
jgi:hypothetical protein